MAYKQQKFISHLLWAKSPGPSHHLIQCLERTHCLFLDSCLLTVSPPGRSEGALWCLFYKGTNPIHNYLSKAPPPDSITLGVRISAYEFGGDINIQSLTVFLLLNTSLCARRTVRPNKLKCGSLEQRKVYSQVKQGKRVACAKKPELPDGFQWEVLKGKFRVRLAGCVTFFWLPGGEVTGWCSRNLMLSLKLPSSTWVGTLVPAEEFKGIIIYIFLQEEQGPSPKSVLLFLDFSLVSAFAPFPD